MSIGPKSVFRFLASYGVAVVLLLLLSLLTFLGTLEQVDQGLYAVQKEYFDSFFLVHTFFGVLPMPLPGVFLLMICLAVNLVCGGIIRARKGWGHAGILIAHVGILVLLIGAFVTFKFSERGHITFYEGETQDSVASYDTREPAMPPEAAGGPAADRIIPGQSTSLPFAIRLDRFTRELYPGSNVPKAFMSDVTVIDRGDRRQVRISMNAPLRYKGYTFYQASWGPADAGPGDPLYSSLAVVRNPADQFPLYACCVICFGLLVHFSQGLVGYLRAEGRKRS